MYCEDVDLCRRLTVAGWSCVYVPRAIVTHIGAHATRLHSTRMLGYHHRSLYRYLARQYGGFRYLWLRPLLAAGLAVRFVAALAVDRVREGARPTRSADLLEG
jgi:N-acetylglucosaminyl-diphospho-decaprenol L-rhamnosyltransferase